jgi:hypothetical protein
MSNIKKLMAMYEQPDIEREGYGRGRRKIIIAHREKGFLSPFTAVYRTAFNIFPAISSAAKCELTKPRRSESKKKGVRLSSATKMPPPPFPDQSSVMRYNRFQ